MMERYDFVIVGGGLWGLSIAFHLAIAGRARSVALFERGASLAQETSRQAAGQIGLLRSDSLTVQAVHYTGALLDRLADDLGYGPRFVRCGSIHLALVPERLAAFQGQVEGARALGVNAMLLSPDEIRSRLPGIESTRVLGGLRVEGDGYVDPSEFAAALGRAIKAMGVTVRLATEVTGLGTDRGAVTGVRTAGGFIGAERVALALGPWSRALRRFAGVSLAMYPVRLQQVYTEADPRRIESHPVLRVPDLSCYLRPARGGYLYGVFDSDPLLLDPAERPARFTTNDLEPPIATTDAARDRLASVFPRLGRLGIVERRQGLVSCTPDGRYLLGPVDGVSGLYVAAGCNGMGVAGGGAVGKWMSEWMIEGRPSDGVSALLPNRFSGLNLTSETLREACRRTFMNYYALASVTYHGGETSNH